MDMILKFAESCLYYIVIKLKKTYEPNNNQRSKLLFTKF